METPPPPSNEPEPLLSASASMSAPLEQAMDAPPPTQTQRGSKSTIFSNNDGSPMRVFAQADLPGRGKLGRELRANGADLVHDLTVAQIILVDADSDPGRLFIRNWGKDPGKVILRYGWARKSIEAGRSLLEGDNWGECIAQDDGAPIEDGDEEDVGVSQPRKSPLPTPRVTPVEVPKKNSQRRAPQQPSVTRSHAGESDTATLAPLPPAPPSSAAIPPTSEVHSPQLPTPGISPMAVGMNPFMMMQNMPNGANMMNMVNPNMPAMNMPNMNMPMNMANMPMPMNMGNMNMANAMPAAMMMMMQMMMGNGMNQEAFTLSLQDAVRNSGGISGMPTTQPNQLHNGASMSPTLDPPLPFPNASPSPVRRSSFASATSALESISTSSRDSSSPENALINISKKLKGKQKASSPAPKRRKVSSSSSKPTKPTTARPASVMGPPLLGQKILTKGGRGLLFYVQVECHNRMALVTEIKKNGGMIETEVAIADYVVLTHSGTKAVKVFKDLLAAAQAAGRPAVQAKFIHESVQQGRLLDPQDYMFAASPLKKRKRSMSTISVESEEGVDDEQERRRLAKNAREADRRRKKMLEKEEEERKEKKKAKVKSPTKVPRPTPRPSKPVSVQVIPAARPGGARTPTPPPESTRQLMSKGYRFTEAENDFARRYAKILIERDYTITRTAIAAALFKQMDHHPERSWQVHLTTLLTEADEWRKRAGIAFRKAEAQAKASASAAAKQVQEEIPIAGPSVVSTQPTTESMTQMDTSHSDLEDDINTVVQFFVDGNDSNPDEDESLVWQRLGRKARCKTEASWEDFYEKYANEVVERYNVSQELNG